MTNKEVKRLRKLVLRVRKDVVSMVYRSGDGHIPSALSIVEVLVILYTKILKITKKTLKDPNRNRFILSKGHGCASFYSVLARKGFFSQQELKRFCTTTGILGGHPDHNKVPGVEISTGSLGQGFPMAVGFAISAKLSKSSRKIFCLVGDGECNEGSVWEAASIASHRKLDNLIVIVDYNKFQSSGRGTDVQNPFDLEQKWKSFGWETRQIDGHNLEQIFNALNICPAIRGKPTAVIANTVKGKGISFMENDNKWHTGIPSKGEYLAAIKELNSELKKI